MSSPFVRAQKVQSLTGKSMITQFREAFALRRRPYPIGISEYFEYGAWDPAHTEPQRQEFIGWRESAELDRNLNANNSRVMANDKLLNYLILNAAGLPIPRPIATYHLQGRRIADEASLAGRQALRDFLAGDVFPFYSKPISAGYGRGVAGVAGWADADTLALLDGTTVAFDKYFKDYEFLPYHGMLLQKCVAAHPAIADLTGTSAVSCVRMICFVTPKGPVVHTAFWKIATGKNMLDNFSHGDYGNCLGAVNLADGSITHAIARMEIGGEVTQHPNTGKPLVGFRLPDWERAVDLVKTASGHFPGLCLQNWDVAMCEGGPVLIELNTESELGVPQAINRRGLKNDDLKRILAEIANGQATMKQAMAARA